MRLVGLLCLLLVVPVQAQEESRVGRLEQDVTELRKEVGELRKALAQLIAIVKAIPKQPTETPEESAKRSRAAMEKTCTDIGLKFRGVTSQQQPTQTVAVQCGP